MHRRNIREAYFNWLVDICNAYSCRDLAALLHGCDFVYRNPMDGNRYEDGVALRYRFSDESEFSMPEVAAKLDIRPCTMLEMMAALDLKLYENILNDGENRPGMIFSVMLKSLGLPPSASPQRVIQNIEDLRRGRRKLFPVSCDPGTEIWDQAQLYLNGVM